MRENLRVVENNTSGRAVRISETPLGEIEGRCLAFNEQFVPIQDRVTGAFSSPAFQRCDLSLPPIGTVLSLDRLTVHCSR
jgi:hypothetical protein